MTRVLAAQAWIAATTRIAVPGILAMADSTQATLGRLDLPAASTVSTGLGTVAAASLCGLLGAAAGVVLRNPALAPA